MGLAHPFISCPLRAMCFAIILCSFYKSRNFFGGILADGGEGEAEDVFAEAHVFEGGFYSCGVAFCEEQVDAGEYFVMDFAGFIKFVDEGEVYEVGHFFGETVGGNGYDAFHAYGHLCYNQVVIAGKNCEVIGLVLQQFETLLHIATGFFYSYNVVALFCKADNCSG